MARCLNFEEDDKLDREVFANDLYKIITKFYPFHDEAFVVSLNATYGSGKSSFLRMWQDKLKNEGYFVVNINAWDTDFDEDPIIPIASEILNAIEQDSSIAETVKDSVKIALSTVALIANAQLNALSGINLETLTKEIEENADKISAAKSKALLDLGESVFQSYSFKKKAYEHLRGALSKTIEGDKVVTKGAKNPQKKLQKPFFIFVDELDRVRPSYAVAFLEAIKHIFSVQGICFVLAVDKDQLEKSIKQLYGDIDFGRYYLRFITREANLPESYDGDIGEFVEQIFDEFFLDKQAKGLEFSYREQDELEIKERTKILLKIFRLKPREIISFFTIFAQFMAIEGDKKYNSKQVEAIVLTLIIYVRSKIGDGDEKSMIEKLLEARVFDAISIIKQWLPTYIGKETAHNIKWHENGSDKSDVISQKVIGNLLAASLIEGNLALTLSDGFELKSILRPGDHVASFLIGSCLGMSVNDVMNGPSFLKQVYYKLEKWSAV